MSIPRTMARFSATPWTSVLTAVSLTDGGGSDRQYAALAAGANGVDLPDFGTFTPDAFVLRDDGTYLAGDVLFGNGNDNTGDPSYVFDTTRIGDQSGMLLSDPGAYPYLTPGVLNPVPEPATVLGLSTLVLFGLGGFRRLRSMS